MKRILLSLIFCILLIGNVFAESGWQGDYAADIRTDTTEFDNNLSVLDDTVQKALETLDELSTSSISDTAYGASWDTVTTVSPSKNAIYDAGFLQAEVDPTVDTSAEIQAILGAGIYEPAGITESDISDLKDYLTIDQIDTFSELDAIVVDKDLVNKADGAVWLGVHDFGGAVLEMPNGTSGTTDATGEFYLDTNGDGGTNFSGEVVQIYTGAANKYLFPMALPLAASQDNYIPKYDASTKTISWEADADSGGAPTLDDIGDPDAATIILLGDTETVTFTTSQNTAGSVFTIDDTVADVTNNVYLLELKYTDDGQANADFFKCADNNGDVKFSIQENGNTLITGTLGVTGAITGSLTGNADTASTASAGDSATAFFGAGTIEHERGGLEADVSAYAGLVKITGGATSAVTLGIAENNVAPVTAADVADNDYAKFTATGLEGRSYAEVLSDIGAQGTLTNSAGLLGALNDETGTDLAVFSNSPTFTDDIIIAAAGVKLTGSDGDLTILGLGDGFDEDLNINLDDTENTAVISSSTGITKLDFGNLILEGKHNSSDATAGATATTGGLVFKDGLYTSGAATGGSSSKSFIITNPTSSADSPVWRAPSAITITAVHVLCVDGTNIVGQLWEYDANGANGAVVDDSDITGTAGTNVDDDGTLSNASIDAGDYVGWKTTSVSGAVTKAIITFDY